MNDIEIVIIGAGPVGLALAGFLGRQGVPTTVLEHRAAGETSPRAIGVSVPSLEIFDRLDLSDPLCNAGVPVPAVHLHGSRHHLGTIDFARVESAYRYVLSLPQNRIESIIEESLDGLDAVTVRRGFRVESVVSGGTGVEVGGTSADGSTEVFCATYAVGCDGGHSTTRSCAGIDTDHLHYKHTFLMGDFPDETGWGTDAHVFFTDRGSVESFPLPEGNRRFVLRTPTLIPEYTSTFLEKEIGERCHVSVSTQTRIWESAFTVERMLAHRYYDDTKRILLAGDAAHLMSPIVGQNMNTGFADAEFLGSILPQVLDGKTPAREAFAEYDRTRRASARAATRRAALMMRLGTSSGAFWSPVRNGIAALLLTMLPGALPASLFSMASIPNRNLRHAGRLGAITEAHVEQA